LFGGNIADNRQLKHFPLVSLNHTNNPGNKRQQENKQINQPAYKRNEAKKQA
jgi:hypothetical protein